MFLLSYAHHLLCACWHLEAMKGSSSLTSCRLLILSRPLSSLIWVQLTLLVPALWTRSPLPQNGAPIHRVRAHSLTGIRNRSKVGGKANGDQCQSGVDATMPADVTSWRSHVAVLPTRRRLPAQHCESGSRPKSHVRGWPY